MLQKWNRAFCFGTFCRLVVMRAYEKQKDRPKAVSVALNCLDWS
jgi:hypothetical protein